MKTNSVFRDSSFWSLFIINLAIIFYYYYYHTGFKTLIWIYWCQSVLIGFFTFLDLMTLKNVKPETITENGKPMTLDASKSGCAGLFFAVHFGIFHFVYLIFLFTITNSNEILDWRLFQFSVGAFALDQLWNFIRRKEWEKAHPVSMQAIFILPYARIVPMHLTILLPKFIGFISQLGLFLFLKMLADLVMYAVTFRIYGKPEFEDPTILKMVK